MPIDKSGEFWRGTESADLEAYLRAFRAGGYSIVRTAHARCAKCGRSVFAVRADDVEGYADRRCQACGDMAFMLDSEDIASEATPESCECPCGGEAFEVAVGFALYDERSIRWVSVGLRCVRDGTLGVYADWKIDYEPSERLFARA